MNMVEGAMDKMGGGDGGGAGEASVLVTKKADGSFEVQAMTDGQPSGEATPAESLDEALQAIPGALGEGSPEEEATETPEEETAEPQPEQAAETTAGTEQPMPFKKKKPGALASAIGLGKA